MGEHDGAIRRTLLREIDDNVSQFELLPSIRPEAAVIEDFYPRGLFTTSEKEKVYLSARV